MQRDGLVKVKVPKEILESNRLYWSTLAIGDLLVVVVIGYELLFDGITLIPVLIGIIGFWIANVIAKYKALRALPEPTVERQYTLFKRYTPAA